VDQPLFKGLSALSLLLDQFTQTLLQEMKSYEASLDSKRFQEILNTLGYTLSEFTQSFDSWHALCDQSEQYEAVQALELKVDGARHLITNAIGLLKTP
jgi:hypothetical protein